VALRGELVVIHQLDRLILSNHICDTPFEGSEEGGGDLVSLAGGPANVGQELHLQAVFLDEGGVVLVLWGWGRGRREGGRMRDKKEHVHADLFPSQFHNNRVSLHLSN